MDSLILSGALSDRVVTVELSAKSFTAIQMISKQREITVKGDIVPTVQSSSINNTGGFDAKPSLLIFVVHPRFKTRYVFSGVV